MSTNYYFRVVEGPLAACAPLHIGKISGGWQFSFQGFLEEGGLRALPAASWGSMSIQVQVPRLMLRSFDDWMEFLSSTPGVIVSEYDEEMSFADFERMVRLRGPKATTSEEGALLNHFDYLKLHEETYGPVDPAKDWKDPLGYSFCAAEFC